jgi:hypothetical protein
MTPAVEDLRITPSEIERLSGLETSASLIGGLLWGTYRWPLRSGLQLLTVVTTELLVLGLLLMVATPIGSMLSRNAASDQRVVQVIVAIALTLWLIRQLVMGYLARQFRSFMRLLDEVDHYHQVLEAVGFLSQLGSVEHLQLQIGPPVFEALGKARESLVAALITEKILRDNRGLLSRREALIETIEQNLVMLRSLELQHQAQDYGDILDQALNIGIRVQQEVTQLTRSSS